MKYIITEEELNNLVQYLNTRPYGEVAEGIAALQNLEKIQDKK